MLRDDNIGSSVTVPSKNIVLMPYPHLGKSQIVTIFLLLFVLRCPCLLLPGPKPRTRDRRLPPGAAPRRRREGLRDLRARHGARARHVRPRRDLRPDQARGGGQQGQQVTQKNREKFQCVKILLSISELLYGLISSVLYYCMQRNARPVIYC